MNWTVERHGGACTHKWRLVYEGAEDHARKVYERNETELRQGGIRLRDDRGEVNASCWAPRLRTRW